MRPLQRLCSLLAWLIFLVGSSFAQESSGRIVGTVTDPSRAVIEGAVITVTNTGTGIKSQTTSRPDGSYQVLSLPVGSYTIETSHAGFQTSTIKASALEINQTLRIDVKLSLGSTTETIEVDSKAATVETINPTLGTTISSRPVQDLPLNGRNVLDLALLQPGVTPTDNPGNTSAGTYSIAGGRSDSVSYILDGGNNNNLLSNGVVFTPNPDAVAEFRVLESNYTAEYGRNGGGIISVATKSGTNKFHGSAFDFNRNDAYNANRYFNKVANIPRNNLKRNQFGGTVGGPIGVPKLFSGKDKYFFFFGYQGQRQTQQLTDPDGLYTVYTPSELIGDFSKSGAGGTPDQQVVSFLQANPYYQPNAALAAQGIIAPTSINPVAQKYIALGVIPSSPTGQLLSTGLDKSDSNEYTAKLDFNFTDRDQLQTTLGRTRAPHLTPFSGGSDTPFFPVNNQNNRYYSSFAYTKIFRPNLLNVARFTAQRINTHQAFPARSAGDLTSLGIGGITPDEPTGPPRIELLSSGLTLGFSPQGPTALINNTFEYQDTLTWVKGRHTMKYGFSFAPYQNNTHYDFYVNGDFFFYGQGGSFSQNDKADFLTGLPDEYLQFGAAPSNIRSKSYTGFGQDEWKMASNFTLTYGLRYEYSTPKIDSLGRSFSLQLGANSQRFANAPTGLLFPGDPGAPQGANFPDRNDFAPRLGFAWDPFKDGKTSIRGGAGIFYDILKGEDNLQFNGQAPFFGFNDLFTSPIMGATSDPGYLQNIYTSTGSVNTFPSKTPPPNIDFNANGFLPFGGGGVFFVDPNLRTPYTLQYNLSFQREVAPQTTFQLAYVGSSSRKLTSLVDTNPFILGTPNRIFNNQSNARPNTLFSYLDTFRNVGNQSYNSLQGQLSKQVSDTRFLGTTYFTLGYTWSHNIDNASGFRQRNSEVPYYNPSQFRANSDIDIRHRLTLSGGWDLPFANWWVRAPKRISKGWSLYPILSYRTGFPLDVFAGLQRRRTQAGPSGAGDSQLVRPNLVGNTVSTLDPRATPEAFYFMSANFDPNVTSGYGTLARNSFRGPNRFNTDMALAKTTPITERVSLEFRAEFFNIFNNVEFQNPNTNINDASHFGRVTDTYEPRIGQLALRLRF